MKRCLLTLVLLFSEVHPFGSVTAEPIPVDIVTPQDLSEKPNPPEKAVAENEPEPPTPQPDFSLLDKPAPPPSAQLPAAARPQKQAALVPPRVAQPHAAAQPQPQPAAPAYKPPEPDLSIKYQVILGLPPDHSGAIFGPAQNCRPR